MKLENLLHLVEDPTVRIVMNHIDHNCLDGTPDFLLSMLRDEMLEYRIVSIEVRENRLWVWVEEDV